MYGAWLYWQLTSLSIYTKLLLIKSMAFQAGYQTPPHRHKRYSASDAL